MRYKLADDFIRNGIIGNTSKFDFMGDQIGFNSAYSNGNYEYIVVKDYTARFSFDEITPPSSTVTTMRSYRAADNALSWEGNLICGVAGGYHPNAKGIACYNIERGPNPAGGAGCNINMGRAVNGGWHELAMSNHNSDTYLYICNGAQHSSSFDMNHRWFFREQV